MNRRIQINFHQRGKDDPLNWERKRINGNNMIDKCCFFSFNLKDNEDYSSNQTSSRRKVQTGQLASDTRYICRSKGVKREKYKGAISSQ